MLNLRDLELGTTIELESLLGARLLDALGATEVACVRMLLLDGAEVVQEGRARLLGDMIRAGLAAGMTVVLVTRTNAEQSVRDAAEEATRALAPSSTVADVAVHNVVGFSESEIEWLVGEIPSVRTIAAQPRARWLLARPGLLKLLVESETVGRLPTGPLCEAEVYGTIWHGLVRRGEQMGADGATPDGRDSAITVLAYAALLPGRAYPGTLHPDPRALSSLRADGVLLPIRTGLLRRTGDQFASDLLRDIAVTRVLIEMSPQVLVDAESPRWTMDSARVAFQSLLLDHAATAWQLESQLKLCRQLAGRAGERWADLPWEAALLASDADTILGGADDFLRARKFAALQEVLRVTKIRFGGAVRTDPTVGAVVGAILARHWRATMTAGHDCQQACEEAACRWLRGLAWFGRTDVADPTRARIRDIVLALAGAGRTDWEASFLGLLGPDLDSAAEARLRQLGSNYPETLHGCLEDVVAPMSMAAHRPRLLLALAEQYYLIPPSTKNAHQWASAASSTDLAVRPHRGYGGLSGHLASFAYGPFLALFQSRELRGAIDFVKRLIDHASASRMKYLKANGYRADVCHAREVDLSSLGLGRRRFVGDDQVWLWYRGMGVGPYPCISALMALELAADRWIASGVSVARVAQLLLENAESLAMAGLVYGIAARYLDVASSIVEPWLAVPEVWQLEIGRTLQERVRFRWAQSGEVAHAERRLWDPMTIASRLVIDAAQRADESARTRLRDIGAELVREAAGQAAQGSSVSGGVETDAADAERVVVAQRWAAMLDFEHYEVARRDDHVEIRFITPDPVMKAMSKRAAELELTQLAHRLLTKYALPSGNTEFLPEDLRVDLCEVAARLGDCFESMPGNFPEGLAALAARAFALHASGRLRLSFEELALCSFALLRLHDYGGLRGLLDEGSVLPFGVDRTAARALPLLVQPSFDLSFLSAEVRTELELEVCAAIRELAVTPPLETRAALVDALQGTWRAPCHELAVGGCHHEVALAAVIDSGQSSIAEGAGAADPARLHDDTDPAFDDIGVDFSRLQFSIAGLADCAATSCCVAARANELLPTLVAAYGTLAEPVGDWNDVAGEPLRVALARGLLRVGGARSPDALYAAVDATLRLHGSAASLLSDLCRAATYDAEARKALRQTWPEIMRRSLVAWESHAVQKPRAREALMVAAMLPQPKTLRGEDSIDAHLREASADWVPPSTIEPMMLQWVELAVGRPECVDAIVFALLGAGANERAQYGLPWIEGTIDGHFELFAGRTWCLVDWIDETLKLQDVPTEARERFRQLVDGLAARGDSKALELQNRLERAR